MLGSARSLDDLENSAQMGKETIRFYLKRCCRGVLEIYGLVYLNKRPTKDEPDGIEGEYRDIGFPGCIDALNCIKLHWKNCPFALKGQYHSSKEGHLVTIKV